MRAVWRVLNDRAISQNFRLFIFKRIYSETKKNVNLISIHTLCTVRVLIKPGIRLNQFWLKMEYYHNRTLGLWYLRRIVNFYRAGELGQRELLRNSSTTICWRAFRGYLAQCTFRWESALYLITKRPPATLWNWYRSCKFRQTDIDYIKETEIVEMGYWKIFWPHPVRFYLLLVLIIAVDFANPLNSAGIFWYFIYKWRLWYLSDRKLKLFFASKLEWRCKKSRRSFQFTITNTTHFDSAVREAAIH